MYNSSVFGDYQCDQGPYTGLQINNWTKMNGNAMIGCI